MCSPKGTSCHARVLNQTIALSFFQGFLAFLSRSTTFLPQRV